MSNARGLGRLAVVGASGRMGRAVVRLATEANVTIAAAIAATDEGRDAGELAGVAKNGVAITKDLSALSSARADCIIDFSAPALFPAICDAAERAGVALVSGTTGFSDAEKKRLDEAATKIAVLWEPNMSVGVFVLGALVKKAIEMLGPGADIEIVEAHHGKKVDAPSGTAMRLAEIAKRARDSLPGEGESAFVFGREGKPGARPASEIGVLAMRGGDVIGDHSVHLLCAGERLELSHRASSRDLFAIGALRCAQFLAGKKPGRYALADVLA